MLALNTAGLSLIKEFEGLRLEAYQDIVGVWTIGYGHTGPDVIKGKIITTDEASALLAKDVSKFEVGVRKLVPANCTVNQFSALVCFSYNVGLGALSKSTLLKKFRAGDTSGAAEEFLKWNRAGGKEVAGLTRRRVAERALFLS
jgi:lysozyme